ncbi:MAG: DUF1330 domain-containing protein [Pseudomonadales bacterium]
MTVYLIAELNINDRERYGHYAAGFMDIFSKYEGKLLSVDESVQVLEGEWGCTRTVLIEFPSETSARDWYESDEYQQLAKHRLAASTANLVLLKGLA